MRRGWATDPVDAAVAVILRERAARDPDVLFIERPRRAGDRWSGDVAFPGGLARPGERAVDTAAREAEEEVAIRLANPLGVLADRVTAWPRGCRPDGARPWMRVRPVLFRAPPDAAPMPDPREVAEAFWFPLARLRRLPWRLTRRRLGRLAVPVPALDLDGHELWGLTLSMALELRRRPLPDPGQEGADRSPRGL